MERQPVRKRKPRTVVGPVGILTAAGHRRPTDDFLKGRATGRTRVRFVLPFVRRRGAARPPARPRPPPSAATIMYLLYRAAGQTAAQRHKALTIRLKSEHS